jgi:hypothetical protein
LIAAERPPFRCCRPRGGRARRVDSMRSFSVRAAARPRCAVAKSFPTGGVGAPRRSSSKQRCVGRRESVRAAARIDFEYLVTLISARGPADHCRDLPAISSTRAKPRVARTAFYDANRVGPAGQEQGPQTAAMILKIEASSQSPPHPQRPAAFLPPTHTPLRARCEVHHGGGGGGGRGGAQGAWRSEATPPPLPLPAPAPCAAAPAHRAPSAPPRPTSALQGRRENRDCAPRRIAATATRREVGGRRRARERNAPCDARPARGAAPVDRAARRTLAEQPVWCRGRPSR